MICPRCTIGEVSDDTGQCALCGFQPGVGVAVHRPVVDEVQETVQRELEGQFRINVLLRHGTRSVVYLADEISTKRMVALKVIPLQRGMQPDQARFEREATVAVSLSHSHIAPVLEFGQTRALLWYSMAYVKGHSLADILRDSGPLKLDQCQKILEQVASALDYMHRRGVTHGNLKPSNILVDREDWTRVSDACVMSAFAAASGRHKRTTTGTPEYMAPEQFRARAVGASADQYALGVVAYECLSGSLPLVGDAPEEMERLHRTEVPRPLAETESDLPAHVSDAVQRALSKTPAERFPTVLDFVALLRKDWAPSSPEMFVPEGRPSSPSRVFLIEGNQQKLPVVPIAATIIVVLLLALGSIWIKPWQYVTASREQPEPRATTATTTPTNQAPTVAAIEPGGGTETSSPTETSGQIPADEGRPAVTGGAPTGARVPTVSTEPMEPGKLFINATPWGQVYIDGELLGNTPRVLTLAAGSHVIRVVRDGFEPYENEIQLAPGQQLRLTDIVLRARQR
jgi:serine/threonine protein kinase